MHNDEFPKELVTGIEDLDLRHATLFVWFRRIFGEGGKVITPLPSLAMNFLVEYVDRHFEEEQFAMCLFGYPDVAVHTREHETLRAQASALQKRILREGVTQENKESVRQLLSLMVSGHAGADIQFARFLNNRKDVTESAASRSDREVESLNGPWNDRFEGRQVRMVSPVGGGPNAHISARSRLGW